MKIKIQRICSVILSVMVALSMSAGLVFVGFADEEVIGALSIAESKDDTGSPVVITENLVPEGDNPTVGVAVSEDDEIVDGVNDENPSEDGTIEEDPSDEDPSDDDPSGEDPSGDATDEDGEDSEDIEDDLLVAAEAGEYYLTDLTTESGSGSFRVQVPGPGYLELNNDWDGCGTGTEIAIKAEGDKEFRILAPNNSMIIGVKEGIYSFDVSTDYETYSIGAVFRKINESSYGSRKSEGVLIKSGKISKGLLFSGEGKQVHWYKFKNPKNQKVALDLYARTNRSSSNVVKISVYGGKQSKEFTFASRADGTVGKEIKIYNAKNKKKLAKGTYYIRVIGLDNCSGYFKLRLK